MYTPKNKISDLIIQYLKGDLNKNQNQELQAWLKESRHQSLFDKIVNKERILKRSREYDSFDIDKAWNQIDKQISQKTDYRKWLSYAAVILLPLAIGFLILKQAPEYNNEIVQLQEIKPGGTNAKLYFSSGDVIDLKEDTASVIRSGDNLLVNKDSNRLYINSDQLQAGNLVKMNRIVTPIGGEYQVELPDGTKVWLNADSYLEFPSKFSDKYRKVIASGELYFDVDSHKDWPFIVESQGVELKVLGTEFNLRSYPDEPNIRSTLVEGSVLVSNALHKQIKLTPGRQVLVDRSNNKMLERVANIEEVTAWRNGKFIFDNQRIEDIMYDLARWYDIKVFFVNSSVKDERFSVDVERYGEIESILKLIEGTGEASFTIKNNVITVN